MGVDDVLLVSGECERFAGVLADVLVRRFPAADREQVRSAVSADAWLLASDVAEAVAASPSGRSL